MSDTVLLIRQMAQRRADRVAQWLSRQGYNLDERFVADGDPLPSARADYAAVVVYGGPQSVNEADEKPYLQDEIAFIRDWTRRDRPFLGICLGGQLLARAYDARVGPHPEGLCEIGYYPVAPSEAGRGFLPGAMQVYHWHTEGFEVPASGELLARGDAFPNQAFRIGRRAYGLQFHPETTVPIFTTWMEEAGHMLERPGARPRDQHFRDAEAHDAPLARWLADFLPRWLVCGD